MNVQPQKRSVPQKHMRAGGSRSGLPQQRVKRQRESGAAAGLLQTGVGQARFNLGLSGSEGEFEANRIVLINATNAFYDNELARINELERTEIELTDLRRANELKRQMALSRATTLTNSFTTDRIKGEEDAADAAERSRR